MRSPGINHDGVDPDSSTDVLIEGNTFDVGDDCVSIKSGRDADGWRVGLPSEDIIVRDNHCVRGENAVCIGSEMSGGVRRVYVDGMRARSVTNAILFKSNRDRGAQITDVYVRGVAAEDVSGSCVSFTNDYHGWRGGEYPTIFQNISVESSSCQTTAGPPVSILGLTELPIMDVTLRNLAIAHATEPSSIHGTTGLRLTNVTVNGRPIDATDAGPTRA